MLRKVISFIKENKNRNGNENEKASENVEEQPLLWDPRNFCYVDRAFPDLFIRVHSRRTYKFYETNNPKVCNYTCEVQFDDKYRQLVCNMFAGNDTSNGEIVIGEWTMNFPRLKDPDGVVDTSVRIYSRAHKGKRLGYYGFLVFRLYLHLNQQSMCLWTDFPSKNIKWEDVYLNSQEWGDQYNFITELLLKHDPEKIIVLLTYSGVNRQVVFDFLNAKGAGVCKNLNINPTCFVNINGTDDKIGFKKDLVGALRKTMTVKMTDMLFNYQLFKVNYSASAAYVDFKFNGIPKHPMFIHKSFPTLIFERIGAAETEKKMCEYNIVDKEDHDRIRHRALVATHMDSNGCESVDISLSDENGNHVYSIVFSEIGPAVVTFTSVSRGKTECLKLYSYIILYDYQFLYRHLFSSEEETRERKNSGEEKGDD